MAEDHTGPAEGDRLGGGSVDELPPWAGRLMHWLDRPAVRWVRVPLGLFLIIVGVLGFLPVLGFWMVPLGALLLAQDIPFLRRPTYRFLAWLQRVWTRHKRRRDERR